MYVLAMHSMYVFCNETIFIDSKQENCLARIKVSLPGSQTEREVKTVFAGEKCSSWLCFSKRGKR